MDQAQITGLCGGVTCHLRLTDVAGHAGLEDDAAVALLLHLGNKRLGQGKSTHQMHIQHALVILHGHIPDVLLAVVAGVIDKDAHRALLGSDLVGQLLGMVGVGNVELVIYRLVAELGQRIGHQLRCTGSHNGHLCACGNKAPGNGKAQTRCTAGDNSHLAGQVVPVLDAELLHLFFGKCCHGNSPPHSSQARLKATCFS